MRQASTTIARRVDRSMLGASGFLTKHRHPSILLVGVQRLTKCVSPLLILLLVNSIALAEEAGATATRLKKSDFDQKYADYLLEDHVDYVSTEFAELLIPTMRKVLRENDQHDPRSAKLRVLIADQLYGNFSPQQFDVVADFDNYTGPGGKSLNTWVKSLQRTMVTGDALTLRRPFSWWSVYLGVSQAFASRSVMRWVSRQQSSTKSSIGEIVVKVILQKTIRQRYRESADEVYKVICEEYSKWYDDDSAFDPRSSEARLHKIVLGKLDKGARDVDLFAEGRAEQVEADDR